MKLYECKRGQWVRILGDAKVPPDAPELKENDVIRLHNIDGMYSYCTDKDGHVVHLVAWAEVEPVENLNVI